MPRCSCETMAVRRAIVGELVREGLYLEALKSYVQDPVQSEEDRGLFLAVLQSCLDHVLSTSPSHLAAVLETLSPRYGRDEGVLLVLGKACMRRQMHTETEYFLQKVLVDVNSECLMARESLREMFERVVLRWHFHMLNDFVRNSSYSRAISNAISRIPDCSVLDIGSGTGLLSMLAVRGGASRVYGCEVDVTMATMSRDIIAANGMTDKISIINKSSTYLSIPQDLPERVSLVVTETVDAGLLGEAIVKTIRHAWSRLLLPRQPGGSTNQIPRGGHVIPCGATVYAMAIECPYIARHSRLLSDVAGGVSFHGITLEGSCKSSSEESGGRNPEGEGGEPVKNRVAAGRERWRWGERGRRGNELAREPYTCERLSCIGGGYSELSRIHTAFSLDFTDPEVPLPSVSLALPVLKAGCLDAVATYYDLHLDPTMSISTSPHGNQNCSWEQAVYPLRTAERDAIEVAEGDTVHLQIVCTDSLLHVSVDKIERGSCDEGRDVGCPVSGSSAVHFVERGVMCRLNDVAYHELYSAAIAHSLSLLQESESDSSSNAGELSLSPSEAATPGASEREPGDETSSEEEDEDVAEVIALDLGHELSILGLMAANMGVDFVQVGRCHDIYTALLETVADNNRIHEKTSIKWAELELTSEPRLLWDIVLCDVVSPQGTLRPGVFEDLGTIRERQSHSDTVILPGKVTVHSVAVSSPSLRAQTTVLGSVPTLGLDIARFINKYQVSHFIDMDLESLTHERLTEEIELFSIDFNSLSSKLFKEVAEVSVEVIRSGCLTAFVYWFSLHFPTGATITTAPLPSPSQSHWHQAAFCLPRDLPLHRGQKLSLRALIADSLLDISLASLDTDFTTSYGE